MGITSSSFCRSLDDLSNEERWVTLSRAYLTTELSRLEKQQNTLLKITRIQISIFLFTGFAGLGSVLYGSLSGESNYTIVGPAITGISILRIYKAHLNYLRGCSEISEEKQRLSLLTTVEGLKVSREAILTTRPRPRYPQGLSEAGVLPADTLGECCALAEEYRELNPNYEELEKLEEGARQKVETFLIRWEALVARMETEMPDPALAKKALKDDRCEQKIKVNDP